MDRLQKATVAATFVGITVLGITLGSERSALPPGGPDPSPYRGPRLKVSSCTTVLGETHSVAFVEAEGRSYVVGQAPRLFCLGITVVREATFRNQPYLCAMDPDGHGACAPMLPTH